MNPLEQKINQECFCGHATVNKYYNPTSDVYKIGCPYCSRQSSPNRSAEKAILNWLNFMASELDQQDTWKTVKLIKHKQ